MPTTTITIGPYNPCLLEPSRLDLQVEDSRIARLTITLGYVNRAVEQLMTRKTYRQNVVLAERICGICSNIHTLCFCQAVEKILGIAVPARATIIRTVVVELERLHSHYLCLGLLAHAVHAGEAFARIMRDREVVVGLLERISGNRVHYGVNTVGGVRQDLTVELVEAVRGALGPLEALSHFVVDALAESGILGSPTAGLGAVSGADALKLGAVGPTLRASGIDSDVRVEEPYAAYAGLRVAAVLETAGDARARFLVRARETLQSLRIIAELLDRLPGGELVGELKEADIRESREVMERVEAPRGELMYYVKSNGTNVPERVKIRTPTYANLHILTQAMRGEAVESARPIIESIDPCLSCTDR